MAESDPESKVSDFQLCGFLPVETKYEKLNPNHLLWRTMRKADSHPNLRNKTYCKLQSQFKLFVLEQLLDLSCHGDRNKSPNKMIAGHIDNV